MPRKPRIEFPGAFYHVISRGNNRQTIFEDKKDFEEFLQSIAVTRERFPFSVYAYVLMTNHFHLLIETHETPLSGIMRSILTRYSRYFNRRHKKIGHLFAARYKAILCQKDTYLLELVSYIHLNPVRAKMVSSPSLWHWSSHNTYLGKSPNSFLSTHDVLSRFSTMPSRARISYSEFVRASLSQGHKKELYPPETIPLLGNSEFIKHIANKQEPRRNRDRLLRISLDDLAGKVCNDSKIELQSLKGNSRMRSVSAVRALFSLVAVQYAGHPVSRVASFLNLHPSAITKAMRTSKQLLEARQNNQLTNTFNKIITSQ